MNRSAAERAPVVSPTDGRNVCMVKCWACKGDYYEVIPGADLTGRHHAGLLRRGPLMLKWNWGYFPLDSCTPASDLLCPRCGVNLLRRDKFQIIGRDHPSFALTLLGCWLPRVNPHWLPALPTPPPSADLPPARPEPPDSLAILMAARLNALLRRDEEEAAAAALAPKLPHDMPDPDPLPDLAPSDADGQEPAAYLVFEAVAAYRVDHPAATWREIWGAIPDNGYKSPRSMSARMNEIARTNGHDETV